MRWFLLSFLGLVLLSSVVMAQEPVAQKLEIGPSGQAYLEALGFRRIDTDVGYYDPTGAVPTLDTGQPLPKEGGEGATALEWTGSNALVTVLTVVILFGIVLVVSQVSGGFALSFSGEAENAARAGRAGRVRPLGLGGPPVDLQTILAMPDRRRAMVMLAQTALSRAMLAHGILVQPSWTMRDALRHLPKGQGSLEALRGVVMAGERVLFGNRDVTEEEFQDQLARIRPLMVGEAA